MQNIFLTILGLLQYKKIISMSNDARHKLTKAHISSQRFLHRKQMVPEAFQKNVLALCCQCVGYTVGNAGKDVRPFPLGKNDSFDSMVGYAGNLEHKRKTLGLPVPRHDLTHAPLQRL